MAASLFALCLNACGQQRPTGRNWVEVEASSSSISNTILSLQFDGASIVEALRKLSIATGASFAVDPKSHGSVTISLRNVMFRTALDNLASQVNSHIEVNREGKGDVYRFVPGIEKPKINASRATVVPKIASARSITFTVTDIDVRAALRAMFLLVNANFKIAAEVQGTVSIRADNAPFDVTLQSILDHVHAEFKLEDGVYVITRKKPAGASER